MSRKEVGKYDIIIDGNKVGTYWSDKEYHEFEEPFFKEYPKYKNVINWFDHTKLIISDNKPK